MANSYTMAFRLAERFKDEMFPMTPDSVFDAHFYHHFGIEDRKVLFTTKTTIAKDKKDKINKIILYPKQGVKGLIADAVRFDTYEEATKAGYELPSQWKHEEKYQSDKYSKFGLSNIRFLTKENLDDYENIETNLPLRKSFDGSNHRIYVKFKGGN